MALLCESDGARVYSFDHYTNWVTAHMVMGWVLFDVFMTKANCEMCSWIGAKSWKRILKLIVLGFGSLSCGLQFGPLDLETENK